MGREIAGPIWRAASQQKNVGAAPLAHIAFLIEQAMDGCNGAQSINNRQAVTKFFCPQQEFFTPAVVNITKGGIA